MRLAILLIAVLQLHSAEVLVVIDCKEGNHPSLNRLAVFNNIMPILAANDATPIIISYNMADSLFDDEPYPKTPIICVSIDYDTKQNVHCFEMDIHIPSLINDAPVMNMYVYFDDPLPLPAAIQILRRQMDTACFAALASQ